MSYNEVPDSVKRFVAQITKKCGKTHQEWGVNFQAAFANTLLTTVQRQDDGTTFLVTGDIPAMWLRDSTAQVRPYLWIAKDDSDIADMISRLVKKQFFYINIDPYANAFNEDPNGNGHSDDHTIMNKWVWERKYEIDSLCYPIQLAYLLYKNTGRTDQFNTDFKNGVKRILELFKVEQNHKNSKYSFVRDTDRQEDTLINSGRGSKTSYTGMIWSAFRPSDDACEYGYLIPSNMFAVVVLGYLEEIFSNVLDDKEIYQFSKNLKLEVKNGIEKYGVVKNKAGESIYAYEVDGMGHFLIMDDGNVPNLLSAPYLGYVTNNNSIYLQTRKTILGEENPYYYTGRFAKGIGSSHTPKGYIWPITLAMEGLTTESRHRKEEILNLLVSTDAGTKMMHESFDVDNPNLYTREWFSWANMMFCELVMDYFNIRVKKPEQ